MAKQIELKNEDFVLELVEDLGREYPTASSNHKSRMLIFHCPICDTDFRTPYNKGNTPKQTCCGKCFPKEKFRKHGDSTTRMYKLWTGMKKRGGDTSVYPELHKYYSHVTICTEWLDFPTFKAWSDLNGYGELLTIDRINPEEGYSPANCRWASLSTQNANLCKSNRNTSGYKGISKRANGNYTVKCGYEGVVTHIGTYPDKLTAAKAYDSFVLDNNLPHRLNNVLTEGERVQPKSNK